MRRRQGEIRVLRKRLKEWERFLNLNERNPSGKRRSKGHFRKKKPFDCGQSQCWFCSYTKVFGHEPTRQEIRSNLSFEDFLKE